MKTIIITLLAALSTGCYAQTSACDELDQAIEYFGKKEIDSAILVMKHVVDTQQSDTTFCYGRCFNNIPLAYAMQGKFDEAQIWFKKILDSDLNDLEQGTDIMEPYANYHHNACMKMVQVSQEIENPHQALKYLELAESTYRFETFSGTSFEKRAVSIAKWKGSIYEELLLPDSAIFVQLHKILDTDIRYRKSDFESLSNVNFYADLITNVEELIGKNNLGKEKKDLKKAIGQLKISQKGQNRVANFNYRGLNYEIGISDSEKTEKEIVSELLENPFFKS